MEDIPNKSSKLTFEMVVFRVNLAQRMKFSPFLCVLIFLVLEANSALVSVKVKDCPAGTVRWEERKRLVFDFKSHEARVGDNGLFHANR
jgi:hypothetical protein